MVTGALNQAGDHHEALTEKQGPLRINALNKMLVIA